MLAGYYQNSVMQQRDLLEVSFLLDYFRTNPALILEWKDSTESERNKKFGAFQVRKALDDRDAFTERKREAHYKLLCNYGAHASYQGFQMLRPVAGGDAHCGPYFAEPAPIGAVAAEKLAAKGARIVLIACSKSHGEMVLARLRATAPGLAHKVHYADLAQISEIKRGGR